ncbi:hypothetical protein Cgig2_025778 [Carnegiea gigantea]|uniref:Aminotransferase-like plant mobile domain-containing protein n=1 Tax=Carnegiea gigantea TaxID=171969 RepID=A0A9Q1GSG5_9CARY|nr:hypothetical protein Cgig2_025778 [Carnegiea gigantea]
MKKLLDANKELDKLELWLSLHTWKVMSGDMFPRIPYGAAWSVQKYMEEVHGLGEHAWAKAVWLILVEVVEKMQPKLEGPVSNVRMNGFSVLIQVWFYEHTTQFMKHDQGRFTRLEMMVPTVREFMKTDGFRYYLLDGEGVLTFEERLQRAAKALRAEQGKHQDAWHQPTVDVGIVAPNDAGQHSDKGSVNEAHGGQAKVLGESSALPEIDEGEEGANPEGGVSCVDDVVLARHTPVGKGISMASELSSGIMEVGTTTLTDGIGNDMIINLGMQSVEHGLSMTPENTNVEGATAEEACVDPLFTPSLKTMSNTKGN